MPVKNIRFDYYQVHCQRLTEDDELYFPLYDLEPILIEANAVDVSDRTYQYRGEEARLQVVNNIEINRRNIWEIQFLRIRKDILPGIATDDGAFDPLTLEEDEGIGEEVSALYDKEHCVIVVQRNKNSLSPSGIEGYFNEVMAGEKIVFQPIILPEDYELFTENDYYRGVTLTFADIKTSDRPVNNDSSMFEIVNAIERFEGINVEIKISLGNKGKKNQSLNREEILECIKGFKDRKDLAKFEVRKKDSEDARVETYDLIEERLYDFGSFTYSRQQPITHARIFGRITDIYMSRLRELQNILRG